MRLKIGDRPSDIRGDQIQHGFDGARKPSNAQIPADHHQGYADALEKVGQVPVDLAKLHVADLQLFVQGVQFFVGRFQLFLRGFQFLIARLRLFVRGPQFFQSAGMIFDNRLQIRSGCDQLVAQAGAFPVGLPRGLRPRAGVQACLLELDQEMAFFGRGRAPERDHLDGNVLQFAAVLDPEAALPGYGVRLPGSPDRLTEAGNQAFARQFQKILGGLARRKLQVRSGAAPHLNDVHLVVDDDARGSILGQRQPVGFPVHFRVGSGLGSSLREVHPAFGSTPFARRQRRRTGGCPQAIDLVALLHLVK